METNNKKSPQEYTCVVCGKVFVPCGLDRTCCSPFCRTMRITKASQEAKDKERALEVERLDSLTFPPKFNLKEHPRARVEWFFELPDKYKSKFVRFLTPKELVWLKAMAQKRLSEEKFYSGFFVKKGKIVEVRGASEGNAEVVLESLVNQQEDGYDDEN